ncbi:hypothetical protein [Paenibacillus glacialis]|uniref:Pectate lyase superfamily protein domain-containing protein n=1 Tax=Paenibacillus glacialis TaxID=494026 RepID=A0A168NYZ9_9BACL|nr:hypothetical protein [Paenibacillus glacialis]OAB46232.1 hypothetical protein PGLA_02285 [Paenibacillus glacialis]
MTDEQGVNSNEMKAQVTPNEQNLSPLTEKVIKDDMLASEDLDLRTMVAANGIISIEIQESEMRQQKKLDEYGVSISKYTVDPAGVLDSYGGLMSALTASSDEILIPKGVYLIRQNITIPANKKLVFGRNARLKPANGVTITIHGTWVASDDDWIFDMSLGGVIGGDFKVNEIRPEWTGAKGDGITDDAKAFNDAMTLCAKKRKMLLGAKIYKVKSTIENNARGIEGVATYVDGGNSGTLITFDPINKETDLLPCIRIANAGVNVVFENFRISGVVAYNSRYLSRWVDKSKFEAGTYDMFSTGVVAIDISGSATPTFRNISSTSVKVGLLLNSMKGHITSYDCSWSGLIGVYCRRNSDDYFFQGGSVAGTFCGMMLGIINTSNHRGGMSVRMTRVHMGFSPYCIYQVKDTDDYDSLVNCVGLNGAFESVRFEMIGEACIKLLPKSDSSGYYSGAGLTWSPINYTDEQGRWQYSLPDDLMVPTEKQKYCFYFGNINNKLIMDNWDAGGAYKSPYSAGAIGVAYFDHIATDDIMLDGLGNDPSQITVRRKKETASLTLITPQAVEDVIHARAYNPISHGQLSKNPELLSSWITNNGVALTVVTDLSQLPIGLSGEAKSYLGENVTILKVKPDGMNNPSLYLPSGIFPPVADTEREICFEYFVLCEVQTSIRTSLGFASAPSLYDQTYTIPALKWLRIRNRGLKQPGGTFLQAQFGGLNKTTPLYLAGVMVSYDQIRTYSPVYHAYTNTDFEIGDKRGLILTDTVDGNRSKLTLTNGSLQSANTNIKTKVYSPNGVPYKLSVADDGTLTTTLDALVYASFDQADSTTSLGSIIGGEWTVFGKWGILSNEAYPIDARSTQLAFLSVGTTNYNVGCTMKGQSADGSNYSKPGILIKYIDLNNHFWVELTNTAILITKRLDGLGMQLASVAFTPVDDVYFKMRVAVMDNVISVYLNGDLKLSYKLTPVEITVFGSSQNVGLRHRSVGTISTPPPTRFNNFVVERI